MIGDIQHLRNILSLGTPLVTTGLAFQGKQTSSAKNPYLDLSDLNDLSGIPHVYWLTRFGSLKARFFRKRTKVILQWPNPNNQSK